MEWVEGTLEAIGEKQPESSTFGDWFNFLKEAVAARAKVNDYCLWKAYQLGCAELALYLISIGVYVDVMPIVPRLCRHGDLQEVKPGCGGDYS